MTDQKPTKDPNDAAALSPENVVYGIAGMVFVILILLGPARTPPSRRRRRRPCRG